MRCKVGDLAMVIKANPGCELLGLPVLIKGQALNSERLEHGDFQRFAHLWVIEHDGDDYGFTDDELLPIRDDPGTDETLTWAPKEVKV